MKRGLQVNFLLSFHAMVLSSNPVANKMLLIREDELGHMLGFDPVLEAP